jgi:hypothetical protein
MERTSIRYASIPFGADHQSTGTGSFGIAAMVPIRMMG